MNWPESFKIARIGLALSLSFPHYGDNPKSLCERLTVHGHRKREAVTEHSTALVSRGPYCTDINNL